jgi:hypothetical protein
MSRTFVVRYEMRADTTEENRRLVEEVFAELALARPEGLRYASFLLADGVSFVHVGVIEGEHDALAGSAAFQRFQQGFGERVANGPVASEATLLGSYGFPPG